MHAALSAFVVVLFVVLTPGVLLRLPPKGGKYVVAIVHGLVFSFVLHLAYKNYFIYYEGVEMMKNEEMKKMKKMVEGYNNDKKSGTTNNTLKK